jgi:hypothetical protein
VTGDFLALLSFIVAASSGASWARGINRVSLQGKRPIFIAAFGVAFALSVAAFIQGTGMLGSMGAGFALLGSGMFLGLATISGQEAKEPAVSVGSPILDFTAPLDDDTLFDSTTLRGRPFLLKFFRGHW